MILEERDEIQMFMMLIMLLYTYSALLRMDRGPPPLILHLYPAWWLFETVLIMSVLPAVIVYTRGLHGF